MRDGLRTGWNLGLESWLILMGQCMRENGGLTRWMGKERIDGRTGNRMWVSFKTDKCMARVLMIMEMGMFTKENFRKTWSKVKGFAFSKTVWKSKEILIKIFKKDQASLFFHQERLRNHFGKEENSSNNYYIALNFFASTLTFYSSSFDLPLFEWSN